MKLLLNEDEDLPLDHDSIPVTAMPEVRMVTTTPYKVGETTWSKVDLHSLKLTVPENIGHYLKQRYKDDFSTFSAHFEITLPSIQSVPQSAEHLFPSVYCTVKNDILHKLRSVE